MHRLPTPAGTAACASQPELFQHPSFEAADGGRPDLRARATAVCGSCPLQRQCLIDAVTRFDVAGFVAGTTPAQRARLRAILGVRLAPENLDSLAGAPTAGRPIDRAELLRLRAQHPDDTLEQLAQRMGCSTSTVKRQLRAVRRGLVVAPEPTRRVSPAEVIAAAAQLRLPTIAA